MIVSRLDLQEEDPGTIMTTISKHYLPFSLSFFVPLQQNLPPCSG